MEEFQADWMVDHPTPSEHGRDHVQREQATRRLVGAGQRSVQRGLVDLARTALSIS
jgi:hypothetical protein